MKSLFNKIKFSQLYTLCNIIAESEIRQESYIKGKYLEKALWFEETLSLLENLHIVKKMYGELIPSKNFSNSQESLEFFRKRFLTILFSVNGEVSNQLKSFLVNFQIETDKIIFKPTVLDKIKFSDIRNLLLELEFIFTSSENSTYVINFKYFDLFVQQFSKKKISPETLKRKQEDNDSIGFNAEKAVIEFEVKRLVNISIKSNEIKHISQENVLAGYDIKSFENYLDNNSNKIERYIEVKAVSITDCKFYWSKNEMEIAKVLGEKYFLYLLPVISNNLFDFKKLMIVNNPIKNIYSNSIDWKKEVESLSFYKPL